MQELYIKSTLRIFEFLGLILLQAIDIFWREFDRVLLVEENGWSEFDWDKINSFGNFQLIQSNK